MTTMSATPVADRIRALWPATCTKGYACYLSEELDAKIELKARGIPQVQVFALLDGMRDAHDQFPGIANLLGRLKALDESSHQAYRNVAGDRMQKLREILQSPRPLIQVHGEAVSDYTGYWLDRAARVLLNRLYTIPAPTDSDDRRCVAPARSPDDIHFWHAEVSPEPSHGPDDPCFTRSAGRTVGQDPDSRFLTASANVCAWVGWDRVKWRGKDQSLFAGVKFRENGVRGDRSAVVLWRDAR